MSGYLSGTHSFNNKLDIYNNANNNNLNNPNFTNTVMSKSKLVPSFNNNTNNGALMNFRLIAQIRRRIMYFFKKFTASGRKKFLSKWEVRKRVDDKSDFSDNTSDGDSSWFQGIISIFKKLIFDERNSEDDEDDTLGRFLLNPDDGLRVFFLYFFTLFNSIFFVIFSILIIYSGPEDNDKWMKALSISVWILESIV